jgi:outer membrane receptor protein involved in Fe transport
LLPEYRWSWSAYRLLFGLDLHKAQASTRNAQKVDQTGRAVYSEIKRELNSKTSAVIGVRSHSVTNRFQENELSTATKGKSKEEAYSLGLHHKPNSSWAVRMGYLLGYRFPNADELYYFVSEKDPIEEDRYRLIGINSTVQPMQSSEAYFNVTYKANSLEMSLHIRDISTDDEIGYKADCGVVLVKLVGCNANLFDTKRQIHSLTASWEANSLSKILASFEWIDSEIKSGENEGSRVPLTPTQVFRLGIDRNFRQFNLHALAHRRSKMFRDADESNSLKPIPSRTVVDAGVSTSLSSHWDASVWVRNLNNRRYYDFAKSNGIYPADGRSIQLVVNGRF